MSNFIVDGDEIYQRASEDLINSENSRFNYKTKECKHWYSLEIVKEILAMNDNTEVLILGVALGGQIVHLLDKDKDIYITGVDITNDNFHIVQKYSDKNRLELIKEDAYSFVMNSNKKYNVIVCDIFMGMTVADFAIKQEYLNKLNELIVPGGKLLLNTTYDTDSELVVSRLQKAFTNSHINVINNPRFVNNLYFVTKK
jgi:spermidine synthase